MPSNTPPHDEKTMRVGIFFDGTGNHKHPIAAEKGPTNIAALSKLYAADQSSLFSICVKGLGLYEVHEKGRGSSVRVDPLSLATGLGKAGGHARMAEAAEELLKILGERASRPLAGIVLDLFAFSRGAALARHFVSAVLLTGLPDPRREVDVTAVPRYSAGWTVNEAGRVALRPGLARELPPKSKHIVDGVYLVDGMRSAGTRPVFNNSFKQRRPRNEN